MDQKREEIKSPGKFLSFRNPEANLVSPALVLCWSGTQVLRRCIAAHKFEPLRSPTSIDRLATLSCSYLRDGSTAGDTYGLIERWNLGECRTNKRDDTERQVMSLPSESNWWNTCRYVVVREFRDD